MALTTTSTLAIREDSDSVSSPLYTRPKIQVIVQMHGDSTQILATIAFSNTSNIIQATSNISFTISELDAINTGTSSAYNLLMNSLDQACKAKIEAIAANKGKKITYTARK